MSDQWLFIEPQDVWMFRDNKPFGVQQNFVARSQFPPNPQTMQGAVRTLYMERQQVNWHAFKIGGASGSVYDVVGRGNSAGKPGIGGSMALSGPFVARKAGEKIERLFPVPLDLAAKAESTNHESNRAAWKFTYGSLHLAPALEYSTTLPFDSWRPLALPSEGWTTAEGWMDEHEFAAYLEDRRFVGNLRAEVHEYENRMGIGLDTARHANEQGLLYSARFVRPHDDIGLLVHVAGAELPEQGTIRIGGESRAAHYRRVNYQEHRALDAGERYKIVLLTPAYFSGGALPTGGDWSRWLGNAELVSAAIGKPLAISGWNIAQNRPRPLRHYVPAGSVYYFKGGKYNGKPFTETPDGAPDFGAMGFGCVAVGIWNQQEQEEVQ